jgi:hypothetical protein
MSSDRNNLESVVRDRITVEHVAEGNDLSPEEVSEWKPEQFKAEREQLVRRITHQLPKVDAMEQELRSIHRIPADMTIKDAVDQGAVPETVLEEISEVADPVARRIYDAVMLEMGRDVLFGRAESDGTA